MFEIAAFDLLIEEFNFIDTASPPASSAGLLIRLPLESLVKLACRFLLFWVRLNDARMAAGFVFIVNDIGIILHDLILFVPQLHVARPILSRCRKPVFYLCVIYICLRSYYLLLN